MRKIAFAWVTQIIDFSTYDEAVKYINDNRYNGWRFKGAKGGCETAPELIIGLNGNDELKYTIEVEKPYKSFNMG